MHTKMLVYLLFFLFEISAGTTEFPCKFPCEWRNKTFNIYEAGKPTYTWKFSSDGETSIVSNSVQLQCHQITERFLIVRANQGNQFICYAIFYDTGSPVKFQFSTHNSRGFANQTGEFTDLCGVCDINGFNGEPSVTVYEAVESGTPATSPPVNSVPCNIPSTCTSGIPCDTSDVIPKDCMDTTTESPTSTTEETATITEATTTTTAPTKPKRHCRKKQKHSK
ncbi:uncharacterized protein LOC134727056 [Mytilus trossulus]|uniref:uncharacterized protein LOC134727056 n=1 Tax=Mytilus trossulus TaxID=6551 RepID=UPI003006F47D